MTRPILLLLLVLATAWAAPTARARAPLTVFAAVSLKESLDAAAQAYRRSSGTPVRVAYAASPALARQLVQRAPADVFISADRAWMDHVEARGLLRTGTRRDLLGNALVLVAPRAARVPRVALAEASSLRTALGEGRLALALTASVPAGRYARAAFETLGTWPAVERRVVEAENVRAALGLVARGEARLGVVYRTDALAEPRVRVVAAFPARTHPPIVYPVAVVASSRHPRASHFVDWLRSAEARAIFARRGFVPVR